MRDKYGQYALGMKYVDGRDIYEEEKTIWIDMSKPVQCSYEKYNYDTWKNNTLPLLVPQECDVSTPPPVQYRGMTIRQLLGIAANIKRRRPVKNSVTVREYH